MCSQRRRPGTVVGMEPKAPRISADRKSTRLNSSHVSISYAVFCLKKKMNAYTQFRHCATSKSRRNNASNSTKHKSTDLSGWRQIISLITLFSETNPLHLVAVKLDQTMKPT